MPKRGEKPTPAQASALKRGQAKRAKAFEDGHKRGDESQKERWARLLDGSLTVAELTDEEIARNRVYGHGKQFAGTAPRLPSHLVAAFKNESLKRANDEFRRAVPGAIKRLMEIVESPDTKDNDAINAINKILERGLGKVPDKVVVEGMGAWADAVSSVRDVDVDRELADLSDDNG